MQQYQTITADLTAQYGEPSKIVQEFEAPYSIENPMEAFKEDKATYSTYYAAPGGEIAVDILYSEGKLSTMVAYVDTQNAALLVNEGGEGFLEESNINIDINALDNLVIE